MSYGSCRKLRAVAIEGGQGAAFGWDAVEVLWTDQGSVVCVRVPADVGYVPWSGVVSGF